ncbi:hypothetical protein [Bifidobacterium sp.]|uniref:hypothetical protein n=1 Tax=Bifidobacterium sp. TaxID=41200 RepID=UPI0039E82B0F
MSKHPILRRLVQRHHPHHARGTATIDFSDRQPPPPTMKHSDGPTPGNPEFQEPPPPPDRGELDRLAAWEAGVSNDRNWED